MFAIRRSLTNAADTDDNRIVEIVNEDKARKLVRIKDEIQEPTETGYSQRNVHPDSIVVRIPPRVGMTPKGRG